jgi:hypothetical protein
MAWCMRAIVPLALVFSKCSKLCKLCSVLVVSEQVLLELEDGGLYLELVELVELECVLPELGQEQMSGLHL